MTHYSTLIQRCRATNSLLADELSDEFQRLERHNVEMRATISAECHRLEQDYNAADVAEARRALLVAATS